MKRIAIVTLLVGCAHAPVAEKHAGPAHWSYDGETGPAHWATLDPAFSACGGSAQSPIDLSGAASEALPAIALHYEPAHARAFDNGHTIVFELDPGSYLELDGARYPLEQFHFHHPAEHTVDGARQALELHFVHKRDASALVVLAVLLSADAVSPPELERVLKQLPPAGQKRALEAPIALEQLLPAERGYFRYRGSLTAPPCTEAVTWLVLRAPAPIGAAELAAFAARYPDDSRPVQPRNDRVLSVSGR
jgi:carbonic anhydrase